MSVLLVDWLIHTWRDQARQALSFSPLPLLDHSINRAMIALPLPRHGPLASASATDILSTLV